jgi:hypothetical protein
VTVLLGGASSGAPWRISPLACLCAILCTVACTRRPADRVAFDVDAAPDIRSATSDAAPEQRPGATAFEGVMPSHAPAARPYDLDADHAPAAPPYDVKADLSARSAKARSELGQGAALDIEEDVFLFAATRRDRTFEASIQLARKAFDAFFNGRFARRPARAVTVYLLAAKGPYDTFCKQHLGSECAAEFGFYERGLREIVANLGPGITTLTHELVHPIVQSDFPDAPEWINEGLGALFEMPVLPHPGEIHGAKNWRYPRLRAALTSKAERASTRLDALFAMTGATFRDSEADLHFAMARYACQWLDARGQLWPFYAAWRDNVLDDPTGEKAFVRVVGTAPAQANEEWVRWVLGL